MIKRLATIAYYLLLVIVRWQESVMKRNAREEVYDQISKTSAKHKRARDTSDGTELPKPDDPDLFRD